MFKERPSNASEVGGKLSPVKKESEGDEDAGIEAMLEALKENPGLKRNPEVDKTGKRLDDPKPSRSRS